MLSCSLKEKPVSILAAACTLILCVMLFTLSGCSASNSAASESSSESAEAQSQATPQVNVQILVEAPGVVDFEPFNSSVAALEGATVLQVTQATTLDLVVEDSSYGAFVSSINGLANEGTSGWTYTLNGEQPPVSAGEQEVSSGDEIVWSYIDMAAGGLDDSLSQDVE